MALVRKVPYPSAPENVCLICRAVLVREPMFAEISKIIRTCTCGRGEAQKLLLSLAPSLSWSFVGGITQAQQQQQQKLCCAKQLVYFGLVEHGFYAPIVSGNTRCISLDLSNIATEQPPTFHEVNRVLAYNLSSLNLSRNSISTVDLAAFIEWYPQLSSLSFEGNAVLEHIEVRDPACLVTDDSQRGVYEYHISKTRIRVDLRNTFLEEHLCNVLGKDKKPHTLVDHYNKCSRGTRRPSLVVAGDSDLCEEFHQAACSSLIKPIEIILVNSDPLKTITCDVFLPRDCLCIVLLNQRPSLEDQLYAWWNFLSSLRHHDRRHPSPLIVGIRPASANGRECDTLQVKQMLQSKYYDSNQLLAAVSLSTTLDSFVKETVLPFMMSTNTNIASSLYYPPSNFDQEDLLMYSADFKFIHTLFVRSSCLQFECFIPRSHLDESLVTRLLATNQAHGCRFNDEDHLLLVNGIPFRSASDLFPIPGNCPPPSSSRFASARISLARTQLGLVVQQCNDVFSRCLMRSLTIDRLLPGVIATKFAPRIFGDLINHVARQGPIDNIVTRQFQLDGAAHLCLYIAAPRLFDHPLVNGGDRTYRSLGGVQLGVLVQQKKSGGKCRVFFIGNLNPDLDQAALLFVELWFLLLQVLPNIQKMKFHCTRCVASGVFYKTCKECSEVQRFEDTASWDLIKIKDRNVCCNGEVMLRSDLMPELRLLWADRKRPLEGLPEINNNNNNNRVEGNAGVIVKCEEEVLKKIKFAGGLLKLNAPHTVEAQLQFLREVLFNLSLLQHEAVLPLKGVNVHEAAPCMIFHRAKQCLHDALGRLDNGEVLRCAHALASSLHRMHSRGIVHLDIRPPNVVLQPRHWIDLGEAQFISSRTKPPVVEGSFHPPDDFASPALDVFCFGRLLAAMNSELSQAQQEENKWHSLIQWCTQLNPAARPSMLQVTEELASMLAEKLPLLAPRPPDLPKWLLSRPTFVTLPAAAVIDAATSSPYGHSAFLALHDSSWVSVLCIDLLSRNLSPRHVLVAPLHSSRNSIRSLLVVNSSELWCIMLDSIYVVSLVDETREHLKLNNTSEGCERRAATLFGDKVLVFAVTKECACKIECWSIANKTCRTFDYPCHQEMNRVLLMHCQGDTLLVHSSSRDQVSRIHLRDDEELIFEETTLREPSTWLWDPSPSKPLRDRVAISTLELPHAIAVTEKNPPQPLQQTRFVVSIPKMPFRSFLIIK